MSPYHPPSHLQTLPLWKTTAPGALGNQPHDIPTLTWYPSDQAPPQSSVVLICPGGGYGGLASHEGDDYALFLNQNGIHAAVLKYRLGSSGYRHPIMIHDLARGMRLLRSQLKSWNIAAHPVGVMGSSAGGHLVSTLLTHHDSGNPQSPDPIEQESSRPDFAILCYPVISMKDQHTHSGSRLNLLGENPSPELLQKLSANESLTNDTPPCFIWHTAEDQAVGVENSLQLALALSIKKIPYELHIYPFGQHGIGLHCAPPFENPHPWTKDLIRWIREKT